MRGEGDKGDKEDKGELALPHDRREWGLGGEGGQGRQGRQGGIYRLPTPDSPVMQQVL
ncbi:hypothetical protein [Chroococcidiopsis sp. CCNUC1]|jgi:hypothetical protein|uniref:hypothetical protein n=1 Tax=Chroococcidiopsis sp. CCNUC1 TaxID=2653189 RepID=UPI002020D76A|nr:hypothetical protein [Chroococcidiopsis sp. CCNUC1]URD51456.1 hypothetical protein M5J74_05595 [Chroococcidiopsis sp. CCNUC1]